MTTEFSYLAGYLDGDGCMYCGTTIQKPKNITVFEYSIQVCCVERENLFSFEKHGGYVRQKEQRPKHKIPYVWVLKDCYKFASNVLPYLLDKPVQCKCLIDLFESIRGSNYQTCKNKTLDHRYNIIDICRRNKVSDLVTKENIDKIKCLKPSIEPKDTDFAYLAGLIEAEGTFRIKSWKPSNKPNKVYNASLEIGNTRYPIFTWLIDRFGRNISFIHKKGNKRACAIWSLQSKSLYNILDRIHLFLRTRKKLVCEQLIEFNKTILVNGGDRHSDAFKERMIAIISKRDSIIDEVHKLNKKGV